MNLKMRYVFVCSAIILLLVVSTGRAGDLKVKENDHIVIVGNTFAERMHLFGYFETFLHSRFPEHRLRIRYLAWPAEEVGEPIRPLGFPLLADELREERADIVFVCYGMNESFQGIAGVGHFRHKIESFVGQLRAEKYNGNSPPQVVLVTPIAQETSAATVDVPARNGDLKVYSEELLQVANQAGVHAVDLFSATAQQVSVSYTHLTLPTIYSV